jgi:23S rRNA (cytidine2498-2'-O)-methyltransferase
MADPPQFLFATCQIGAEQALKSELAGRRPGLLPAYSRRGFLTFKLPAERRVTADFDLQAVFARSHGLSLGRAQGETADALARSVWELLGARPFRRIHVWQREEPRGDDRGNEPSLTPAACEARDAIVRHGSAAGVCAAEAADPQEPARHGDLVLDCILVGPSEWWVGYHRARSVPSRWSGGMIPLVLPPHAVSRAWLKMEEALLWSGLPIPRGARCAEIGSAPGGASQALLDRGLLVTGIDPAEMDPVVLAHPHFAHVRRRSTQLPRRLFRKIRWLTADMNVAPNYTLDAVEAIVTHREVNVRGLLLTVKLSQWKLAAEVPAWLERIRSWGYNVVHARQLRYNRQEICVAALQRPFRRKPLRASG